MRPVYLSTFEDVYEAHAIVQEGNNLCVLVKSIDDTLRVVTPYQVADFFDGEILYLDPALTSLDRTAKYCLGYKWIEEEEDWHYVDNNSGTVLGMKKDFAY